MLVPRFWTMVMQATTISANITAYSTAVGPSSLARNRRIFEILLSMVGIPLAAPREPVQAGAGTSRAARLPKKELTIRGKDTGNLDRLTVERLGDKPRRGGMI